MFLLRLVIPTPTPVSPPEVFLRPAVDVGYPVAEVGVKHPSLFSLSRVSLLGVTIGTKQHPWPLRSTPLLHWLACL
jgi:hypothetical protein